MINKNIKKFNNNDCNKTLISKMPDTVNDWIVNLFAVMITGKIRGKDKIAVNVKLPPALTDIAEVNVIISENPITPESKAIKYSKSFSGIKLKNK